MTMPAPALSGTLDTALQYHCQGRAAEAEAAYRAMLDADPEQPAVPSLLGNLLLSAGRARDAMPLLARATTLQPDDPETHLAYANALYRAGCMADATESFRAIVERWPHKAGAWSNLAESLRVQGDLASALRAADRALTLLPGLAEAHLARGNILLAFGRAAEAETAYAAALAVKPDLAVASASRAAALLRLDKAEEAAAVALDAISQAPGLAEARFVLGCALRVQGRHEAAKEAFEAAVELAPNHARAWLNLGNTLADLDCPLQAETAYRTACAHDPGLAEAYSNLGCLLSRAARLDEAIDAFDRAIAIRPDYAEAHWNQGFTLLLAGDFARGWEKYEWRKRHDRFVSTFPKLSGPAWEGEPLAGRRLLIYGEQGFGDVFQFIRYAPLLAASGAETVLACDEKLIPLLRSMPALAETVPKGGTLPPYDYWVDQMSLPRILGTRVESVPAPDAYLTANPARQDAWRARLRPGRNVGMVWAGNPGHSNDARRSMPVEVLKPLVVAPGTNFVSLQVGARAGEAVRLGPALLDVSKSLTDFAETAALIANLDLVITVDTAVAHLAGALGIPVWVMLPHAPDWRWLLGRADSPWYRSMRLFRQLSPGDWTGVVQQIRAALSN